MNPVSTPVSNPVSINSTFAFRQILDNTSNAGDFTAVRLDSSSGKAKLVAFNTSLLRRNVALFARDGSAEENLATRNQLVEALRGEGASEEFLKEAKKYLGLGEGSKTSPNKPLLLREVRQILNSFKEIRDQENEIRDRRADLEHLVDERSQTLSEEEFPKTLADGLKRAIAQASPRELEQIEQKFKANVLVPVPGCVDRIEVTWRPEQRAALESFLSNGFFKSVTRDAAFAQIALDTARGMVISINGTPVKEPARDDSRGYSPDERADIEKLLPENTPEQLKTAVLFFASQTAFNGLGNFMNRHPSAPLIDMAPKTNEMEQTIKLTSQGSEKHREFRFEVEMRSSDFTGLVPFDRGAAVGADCTDPKRLYQNRAVFLIDLDEQSQPRVRLEQENPPVTVLDFGQALDEPTAQRLNGERLEKFFRGAPPTAALQDELASRNIVLTDDECKALFNDDGLRAKVSGRIQRWTPPSRLNASMIFNAFLEDFLDEAVKIHNGRVLAAAQAPADLADRGYSPDELKAFKAAVAIEFSQNVKVANGCAAPTDFVASPYAAALARYPQLTTSKEAYAVGREFCDTMERLIAKRELGLDEITHGRPLFEAEKAPFTRIVLDELRNIEPDAAKWPRGEALEARIREVCAQRCETEVRRMHLAHVIDERLRTLSREEFPQALADGLKRHIAQASPEELKEIDAKFEAGVLVPVPGCFNRIEVAWRPQQVKAFEEALNMNVHANRTREDVLDDMAKDIARNTNVFLDGTRIKAPANERLYSAEERAGIEGLFPPGTPEALKTAVLFYGRQSAFNSLEDFLSQEPAPILGDMLPISDVEAEEGGTQTIKISTQEGSKEHPICRLEVELNRKNFTGLISLLDNQFIGADCQNPNRTCRHRAVYLIDLDDKGQPRVRLEAPPVTLLDFGEALDGPAAARLNSARLEEFFKDDTQPAALREMLASRNIALTDDECKALFNDPELRTRMSDYILDRYTQYPMGLNRAMILRDFVNIVRDAAVKLRDARVAQTVADVKDETWKAHLAQALYHLPEKELPDDEELHDIQTRAQEILTERLAKRPSTEPLPFPEFASNLSAASRQAVAEYRLQMIVATRRAMMVETHYVDMVGSLPDHAQQAVDKLLTTGPWKEWLEKVEDKPEDWSTLLAKLKAPMEARLIELAQEQCEKAKVGQRIDL